MLSLLVSPRLRAVAELKERFAQHLHRHVVVSPRLRAVAELKATVNAYHWSPLMVSPRLRAVAELKVDLAASARFSRVKFLHGSVPWPN